MKVTKDLLDENINIINNTNNNIDSLLNSDKYIYKDMLAKFLNQNKLEFIKLSWLTSDFSTIFKYREYKKNYLTLQKRLNDLTAEVDMHNNKILDEKKELFFKFCSNVEGRTLDDEQVDAIVRDDDNQLVIAGAGCGKTTTIVGKVKYLVRVLNVKPEEILLLSFTKKSASDMKRRVEKEINKQGI